MALLLRNALRALRLCSLYHYHTCTYKRCLLSTFTRKTFTIWPASSEQCFLMMTVVQRNYIGTSRGHQAVNNNKNEEFSGLELQMLDKLVSDESLHSLTASEVTCLSKDIFHAKYQALQAIPWLQENVDIAFTQLRMNKMLHVLEPLWNHEGMSVLVSNVIDHKECFTPLQLCQIYAQLLYLGMDPTTVAAQKLFLQASQLVPAMDIQSLEVLHSICKLIKRDQYMLRPLLSQLKKLLIDPSVEWGPQDVAYLASVSAYLVRFCSTELQHLTMRKLSDVLNNSELTLTADQLAACLQMLTRYFIGAIPNKMATRQAIAKIGDRCYFSVEELTPHNIAIICKSLKSCTCYDHKFRLMVENKALSMLNEDMRPCDVSNLMYCLTEATTVGIMQQFENIMLEKIKDLDILLISNLAENLVKIRTYMHNQDLIFALQEQIVNHGESIISYSRQFYTVLDFFSRWEFYDPEHQQIFTDLILRSVNDMHVYPSVRFQHVQFANYAVYLILMSQHSIDDKFYVKLLKCIPYLNGLRLLKLERTLSVMQHPSALSLEKVGHIQHAIDKTFIEKADNIYDLGSWDVLFRRMCNCDPFLAEKIMELILQARHTMTDIHVSRIARICHNLKCHFPQLYEELVTFMVKERESFNEGRIRKIVEACGTVGHVSVDSDGFLQVALKAYHILGTKGRLIAQLQILNSLSLCQLFPEAELKEVFHIDFLEKVVRFMEDHPQAGHVVEYLMMALNQSVVLECPQLNVPWFHEEYCIDRFSPDNPNEILDPVDSHFQENVGYALMEALNGDNFIRKNVFSPYYHKINYECLLDSNKNPVPIHNFDLPLPPDWQRVAVLTLSKRSYCCNANHLIGLELRRQRHLEILGYKVIEVPIFEWNSMGLSDWLAKVPYLRSKINS